nr:MLX-interacting protein isoform X4 [Caretta caretta]
MAADVFMRPGRLPGAAGPVSRRAEPDEDSSDTDDGGSPAGRRPGPRRGQPAGPQIIHSGHFMVSSPHSEHPPKKGYDFDTVNEQTCQTYRFGAARGGGGAGGRLSIDASLTKLFECMSLAYSGKLVSPKWKNFKGLKLQWRDKIRLNNAIWRAWYMQYLEKRKNPVCHFVTPLDGSIDVEEHRRPEAIATEGKYWKRRIEIVIREYHKWRTYFKKRLQKHKEEDLSSLVRDDDVVLWHQSRYGRETPVPMEEDSFLDADMLMSEFTDTLFSTLSSHQLIAWPNPREIAHLGNADMIQPGLIPLQPNLDFMDTFESFQAAFQGQSRAVIVTPAPLKREGILTPAMSPPSVVIAPAGIARAPGVMEFHNNILVGQAQQAPNNQQVQSTVSHRFSPSAVQDVKGEQIPSHSTCSQVPSPTPSRDCQNSGQASPCPSEQSPSPQSPQNNCSGKSTANPQMAAFKNRRMKHISAEQKRRFNIKIGFSTLNSLVSANSKSISHAITLQKTVEYIAKLQQERMQSQEETRRLREEIEELNTAIISCQQQLPATGVPITRQRFDHMRSMFDEYMRNRTLQNWKFWIFSIIIKPLFESFNGMVSTTSLEDLNQTAMAWLDQHCSLPVLRPMVLNTLRHLSITTSILSDPSRLPEQATEAVCKINKTAGET